MEEMLVAIGNFGFPIVVSAYLLIRIEGKLNDLSKAIVELREAIIIVGNN
ncbi:Hypothetical protein SYNTR_2258 [Candidatus Syntrophocurvum alkaliphilum]|uniref:YvrJ family protein n=1 Tax=Candidatus Syntrophocurvum alkaliphilum TaxID=2293317 RepID=A0A6I6DEH3_9FIRM|nr:YvrJ family protein [Candidatus Syntrophocurvum alkaliphilum]QGU00852.1 Hypothetical protein SYNTR_2258 [Candidatus Syntrophocurvum alkaliphilum]